MATRNAGSEPVNPAPEAPEVDEDIHPTDCLYCEAGEPQRHTYEPGLPVEPIKLGHHLTVTAPPFEEWLSDEVEFSLHTDPTWSYVVGYCHVDVGLMSYAAFDTLSDLYDWLEAQGAEWVS